MKANASKRKIFDAVDMLTENTSAKTTEVKAENGVEQIAIDSIKAFHNHPFHLYEGERLNDMVESIREHGVLNPIIVLKKMMDMKCFLVITEPMQQSLQDLLRCLLL